jgi:hypothetical protein
MAHRRGRLSRQPERHRQRRAAAVSGDDKWRGNADVPSVAAGDDHAAHAPRRGVDEGATHEHPLLETCPCADGVADERRIEVATGDRQGVHAGSVVAGNADAALPCHDHAVERQRA